MPAIVAPFLAEAAIAAPAAIGAGALGAGALGAGALGAGALGAGAAGIGALEGGLALGALAGEGALGGLGALGAGALGAGTAGVGAAAANAIPAAIAAPEIAAAASSPLATLPAASSATGLQSLAQTAGFTPWESAAAAMPQISPEVASLITPTTQATTGFVPEAATAAQAQFAPNANIIGPNEVAAAPAAEQGGWWEATKNLASSPNWENMKKYAKDYPLQTAGGLYALYKLMNQQQTQQKPDQYLRPYTSNRQVASGVSPFGSTSERQWFTGGLQAQPIQKLAVGGPVEMMSAQNAVGDNTMYPQSQLQTTMYSNPMVQRPIPTNVISVGVDTPVDPYTGEQKLAGGGLSSLGSYSDGGRLLKGPGDGVSDSIPAQIGKHQPARLADGEFVVPARIVSELGNGSTEAGARRLYNMMDKVQAARKKSMGKDKVAVDSKASKYLPT